MAGTAAPLKIALFLGSMRHGRLCERVGKYAQRKLLEKKYDLEVFDPLALNLPLLSRPVHFYPPDRAGAPAVLVESEKKIKAADAVVVVSGEYNHTIPPALNNLMSHFGSNCYMYKPSGIICYSAGPFGGMRAAMHLRSFLSELGCISVPMIMGIPEAQKALDNAGQPTNANPFLDATIARLIEQLDWMAHAMRNQRIAAGVPGQK